MSNKNFKIDAVELANIQLPNIIQEKWNNGIPYVRYGENNLFPQEMIFYSNKSTTHAACLKLISLSISGQGFEVVDPAAKVFLDSQDYETSNSSILDKIGSSLSLHDGFVLEVIWNVIGDKIVEVHNLPLENIRAAHPDRYGNCLEYYYNTDWERYPNNYEVIKGFDPKSSLEEPKQILYISKPNYHSSIYPVAPYATAINYIACEYELAKHYLSCAYNSFLPSSLITFVGNPSDEERRKNKKDFQKTFVGTENNGKVILNYVDSIEQKAVIESIQQENIVDQYINTAKECKNNIISTAGITSPSLVAIADGNTSIFSNGEEMRSSWDVFYNTRIKSYHNLIEKNMNLVLKYAGFPNAGYKIKPFTPFTVESLPTDTTPVANTAEKPIVDDTNDKNIL